VTDEKKTYTEEEVQQMLAAASKPKIAVSGFLTLIYNDGTSHQQSFYNPEGLVFTVATIPEMMAQQQAASSRKAEQPETID
jgi:hypothetical protein